MAITDAPQYQELEVVLSRLVSKSQSYVLVNGQDFSTCVYEHLGPTDLLVVALSIESFIFKRYNQYFLPFRKPQNLHGNYTFIRLDISAISLLEGLNTPIEELKQTLFSLEPECRILVELGKELAKMTPTGIIGIDESIIDTCHFGFGDGIRFGINTVASIHLDVVLDRPKVVVLC